MGIRSFHRAYNARHLPPEDVAKTFISSSDYEELLQENHTVLLGARGCGKTTLMKMLTLPALDSWDAEIANEIKDNINFFSVYIATDIYWNAKDDAYKQQLEGFPKYSQVVSKVAVTTNVLYALCTSFEDIIKYKLAFESNDKREIELSKSLITSWCLPPTIPKLSMVKEALLARTDLLNRHIQRSLFNYNSDEEIVLTDELFYLDYDSASLIAISAFERIFEIDNKSKWALCFDELELAPDWLQQRLFTSLRSRDQKFLYKLSASPIVSVADNLLATPENDLKLIRMWPHESGKKYQKFSETLVKSILDRRFDSTVTADELFGSNILLRKDINDDYKKGGETWYQIRELASSDANFKELLIQNKIDPENPEVTEENKGKLDTVLRKVKPIVYFRNYYSSYSAKRNKRISRSRKSATLFYGKEVIYKISDGNPRWLIGIINEMLKKVKKDGKISQISNADQASVLKKVGEKFNSIVKTIPGAVVQRNEKVYTLSGVLKEIGDTVFEEIAIGKFQRDPHSTFIIDKEISDDFVRILEKGVYQGAIVLMDPAKNSFDFAIRGKKFRLSYLFSPIHKIPLRKYGNFQLSNCLTGKEAISIQSIIKFED